MFNGEKSPPVVQPRTGIELLDHHVRKHISLLSALQRRDYNRKIRKNKGVKEKKLSLLLLLLCSCCCFCVNDSLDIDKRAITCRFLLVGLKKTTPKNTTRNHKNKSNCACHVCIYCQRRKRTSQQNSINLF